MPVIGLTVYKINLNHQQFLTMLMIKDVGPSSDVKNFKRGLGMLGIYQGLGGRLGLFFIGDTLISERPVSLQAPLLGRETR